MKKIYFSLAALVLLFSCMGAPKGDTGSLLWKVSGNGLAKPSYLFGTHHLIPITFLDSVSGIHDAFENTEQAVGELDMGNMSQMQMKIMGESTMPAGITFDSFLSATDVTLLDSILTRLMGVGLGQLGTLKPALLSNLISVTLYQQYYPSLSSGKSLDQYFQEEALKRNRPVIGLESTEDQIHVLLNSQTLDRQAELLICMVKHPELLKEQMDKLQVAYHAQDIKALLELYEEEMPDDPCPSTEEEKNLLNRDRNRKWLEKLPAMMADKPSFIAVGCLHLPGKDGLIEGLRKLGYRVEAVK
ncbi:MAG: TraB/GumN family protein [Proteiniphilum sp.]|nr:TraB/GumN family protein [Proteiniphilum sp.]MDD2938498.1 TraB/GumN family protein [Proteiniphilum sp.]MDD3076003.1 TraB/GumN family protein [Proteiniphilum sp.]MDD3779758.1 TraB/GumN family protein [Proteiniphilum sp.]MDD3955274.1 TraB/GumN family protein [Proteiniphilum sp.]